MLANRAYSIEYSYFGQFPKDAKGFSRNPQEKLGLLDAEDHPWLLVLHGACKWYLNVVRVPVMI